MTFLPSAAGDAATSLRVGLLGAGRVAAHLAPALLSAGHRLAFVWSRRVAAAQALAAGLPGPAVPVLATLTAPLPQADIYLLALPDAALPTVLAAVPWPPEALVAHLAGAVGLDVFAAAPNVRGGVFYPLQSFSPGRTIAWSAVPLLIEAPVAAAGPEPRARAVLLALAHSISPLVHELASAERLRLHVAAVFANNFTNHLLGIANALLAEARLPPQLLAPLIHETVAKANSQPPFTAQTGPAVRHDAPTLAAHRMALAGHPSWLATYNQLTDSIQRQAQS